MIKKINEDGKAEVNTYLLLDFINKNLQDTLNCNFNGKPFAEVLVNPEYREGTFWMNNSTAGFIQKDFNFYDHAYEIIIERGAFNEAYKKVEGKAAINSEIILKLLLNCLENSVLPEELAAQMAYIHSPNIIARSSKELTDEMGLTHHFNYYIRMSQVIINALRKGELTYAEVPALVRNLKTREEFQTIVRLSFLNCSEYFMTTADFKTILTPEERFGRKFNNQEILDYLINYGCSPDEYFTKKQKANT